MDISLIDDAVSKRIRMMNSRVDEAKNAELYFYNQPIEELHGGSKVLVRGREMGMYASYSYLGLIGHPRINKAAKDAIDKFGTGTHGVRSLAGTLTIHTELEETISEFRGADDTVTFSSGYVTNLTVISTLMGRHDYVFSDKLNHASIVDGCLMSGAKFIRFRHNDMQDLDNRLEKASKESAKLVIVDSVFSMDGDIIDLPALVDVCKKHGARLMVDEAHSIGVLGENGHGIEEYFGLKGVIDIKMGTLSKTIPSVGGYVSGEKELMKFIRHASRAYIFSAAIPPAQTAAACEGFKIIIDEPWRIEKLKQNTDQFIGGLKDRGFDTLQTETAIVPVICGSDDIAFAMTREVQNKDVFVLPVVSPAVPEGLSRLRATVTAAHESEDIDYAMNEIEAAGKKLGVIS